MSLRPEIGVAGRGLAEPSGDGHLVRSGPEGDLLAVIDGLGHGKEAALATRRALETLRETRPGAGLGDLFAACHQVLRGTRGVAMSLAWLPQGAQLLQWAGVGNVEMLLIQAGERETPVLRGGVVGFRFDPPRVGEVPVSPGATLVMATDGIEFQFSGEIRAAWPPGKIAERILAGYARGDDDALVLVCRFTHSSKEGGHEQRIE